MLIRLLFITVLITVSLFCWLSFENPEPIELRLFAKTIPTNLSVLMISSFVLGALLVFVSTLARDVRRGVEEFRRSRYKRKGEKVKEEINRGIQDYVRGDFDRAKSHFSEALRMDPTQIDIYLKLADIELKNGFEHDALRWLERARLIDSRNVDVLLREADIYERLKRHEERSEILGWVIQIDETNMRALKALRRLHVENRAWQDAIRIQKLIIKATREKQAEQEEELFLAGLRYEHARSLLGEGRQEDLNAALKEAKEIVKHHRDFQAGYVLLGDVLLRLGRWAGAGKVWGKGFLRFRSVIFLSRLEDLYLGREDPNTILRIYQRALRQYPDLWVVRFFYAKLCLRLEMLDEALDALDEISLRQKDFPALHRLIAEVYLHKKDFNRAALEFERTFDMSGGSYLPFTCSNCKRQSPFWIAYCPECFRWDTYNIMEDEKVSIAAARFSDQFQLPL